jgi:hypothetical protein
MDVRTPGSTQEARFRFIDTSTQAERTRIGTGTPCHLAKQIAGHASMADVVLSYPFEAD